MRHTDTCLAAVYSLIQHLVMHLDQLLVVLDFQLRASAYAGNCL